MSAILDFSTEQNVGAETIQCPIGLKVDTRVSLELAKSHGTYFMCPYINATLTYGLICK